ncbi:MAG: hypothetical protein L0G19_09925, partial [Micrococcales bacterium]|nr:hypothetical protein [Micrococcales bacterium]
MSTFWSSWCSAASEAGVGSACDPAGAATAVAVPAAAPDLATGVRIGWGLSFGVLVAAELIAADRGL